MERIGPGGRTPFLSPEPWGGRRIYGRMLARQAVFEYANLLSMSDKDFEGFLKDYRELRKLLRTCVEIPESLMKIGHKKEQTK